MRSGHGLRVRALLLRRCLRAATGTPFRSALRRRGRGERRKGSRRPLHGVEPHRHGRHVVERRAEGPALLGAELRGDARDECFG
jgi:hypothetical protein